MNIRYKMSRLSKSKEFEIPKVRYVWISVDYKNIKLLKAFLTKYGKIRPRRKTRISIQKQHAVARAIRRSRSSGLIPFTCDVKI